MATVIIKDNELEQFKRSWPCHGFPDDLAQVWFVFDPRGDLVDLYATDDMGRDMDTHKFDGPALAALADDARTKDRAVRALDFDNDCQ